MELWVDRRTRLNFSPHSFKNSNGMTGRSRLYNVRMKLCQQIHLHLISFLYELMEYQCNRKSTST